MEEKKKVSLDEQFNDYESTPVPEHARRNWVDQGIVWMGAGLGILATGGLLADGLSFWDTVLASVLGAIVIFIIAGFVGLVSVRLHLSASYTARFSFGRDGSRIFGAILCFSNFGWFAFQADLFGNTVTSILREGWNLETPTVVFTILGGLAMATTAIFGFKAIEKFSKLSFPILLLLCVVAIWRTFSQVPAADIIGSGPVGAPITLPMGVAIVVSSYASGIAVIGDVSRFSRSKKDCLLGLSLGYVWGFIPILLCGSFFTYAFHNWNIVEVMIESLDMGILGAVGLIICQWTTNDNNLYTSVLGVTNTLDGIVKIPRIRLSLIIGVISTAVAAIGMYKYFENFLSILGVFIIPVSGIIVADYYLCNREKYLPDEPQPTERFNPSAVISWLIASFVGLTMTAPPVGFGWLAWVGDYFPVPIIGMAIAMVLYCVLEELKKHRAA